MDTIMSTSSSELDSIKKKELFIFAMKGNWLQVMNMYRDDSRAHKARITRSGDTALHIAVSEGKDKVVADMVNSVKSHPYQLHLKDALQTHNLKRNTALHLAAAMGNDRICEMIASAEPSLVDCLNGDGETPLFLAALFGRTQAFLRLHYIRNRDLPAGASPYYGNCRRNDGHTILHCAINGDHFDLAYQIISLYGDLVNCLNEDGLSPLHLLAAKPSAFRSGCRLGRVETIIYHCLYVEKLKVAAEPRQLHTEVKDEHGIRQYFPPNHLVLCDIFNVIKSTLETGESVAAGKGNKSQRNPKDPEKAKSDHTASSSGGPEERADRGSGLYPANYRTCFNLVKFFYLALLAFLGVGQGSSRLDKIRRKKKKHTWSIQIMNELLHRASDYEYEDNGSRPDSPGSEELSSFTFKRSTAKDSGDKNNAQSADLEDCKERKKIESPILIAAKNGVIEMVKEILKLFPVAIYDENEEKKNIVLLAVEKRQPHVYELLLEKNFFKESLFRQVDTEGNSALHLVAKYDEVRILGSSSALQMQHEIKWYQFVRLSLRSDFFTFLRNQQGETPIEFFLRQHKNLVEKSDEWFSRTSESCSVVAALVAGVAFATSSTIPGGNDDKTGKPTLEGDSGFDIFAIAAVIALCYSVTSLIMFLSILTCRKQVADFGKQLPVKLFLALSSLFVSILSMFISFCAAHSFVLEDKFKKSVISLYVIVSLPISFTIVEFPLYMDLFKGIFMQVQPPYDDRHMN